MDKYIHSYLCGAYSGLNSNLCFLTFESRCVLHVCRTNLILLAWTLKDMPNLIKAHSS